MGSPAFASSLVGSANTTAVHPWAALDWFKRQWGLGHGACARLSRWILGRRLLRRFFSPARRPLSAKIWLAPVFDGRLCRRSHEWNGKRTQKFPRPARGLQVGVHLLAGYVHKFLLRINERRRCLTRQLGEFGILPGVQSDCSRDGDAVRLMGRQHTSRVSPVK